ncbi:Predicted ATP-dependent endonuclease of the OLD family, contains P-loop ATPase and TOPRIM domains [Ruminococcus sp. YRD2003]|uniref:ATP-dependent nuclease n=1 Tax=Ruminococcus sp. YRD2003 TaxID=1452313 RepID=UPI0008C8063F|nr:Predicted ATP-dependent endonuclease of the OLD family, contains P-loop ATPase and TOPRIM domains [Ruminococcus flavefaciens]
MFPEFEELKFKNYKSFEDYSYISNLKNVNVFIGKNNCGKSSCIDVLQSIFDNKISIGNAKVQIDYKIKDKDFDLMMRKSNYSARSIIIPDKNQFIDKIISFKMKSVFVEKSIKREFNYNGDETIFNQNQLSVETIVDDFNRKICGIKHYRLNAERNILPEQEDKKLFLFENGSGATNVILHILNYANCDEKLVRVNVLDALNKIMYPDSKYDNITIQKENNEEWEVFLHENENRFPLSKMGSGLKTIILVLLNILVMPCIIGCTAKSQNINYKNIVFSFEELENNLHPALQRKLFEYLYHFSIDNDTTILLTTHSHVAINMFSDKEKAQLYHIIKENGKSSITKVEDYLTKCEILQDLDVRASDLFQSNGIIWVEGPSDKVYIKHWLELWGDSNLVEGVDYQFLYYGGRILSHFTANPNSQDDNLINILSTNRNSAIVIDSDICVKRKGINVTKQRIKDEFKSVGMFCWITQGKEIENYIPFQAINTAFDSNLSKQCGRNELFPSYIKEVIGKSKFDKVSFAHKVIASITDEDTSNILDLKDKVIELSNIIKQWNSKE